MDSILLTSVSPADFTAVSNVFIDDYMPLAHGDYVKVYLYLLRCLGEARPDISVSSLADRFENTEKDILRAIQYWEQKQLLKIERNEQGEIRGISLSRPTAPAHSVNTIPAVKTVSTQSPAHEAELSHAIPLQDTPQSQDIMPQPALSPRPVYTAEQIACLKKEPQVTVLLHQVEQTLKRLLKPNDVQLILYLYESLGFSPELILYLYEYCISMNKTHLKYIERVAVNWNRDGIRTIEQAQMTTKQYKKEYYSIAKSLGFQRSLADAECSYVEKWLRQWALPLDVILEACGRTIIQTHGTSFAYIDKILAAWHKDGVHSLEDIKKLDHVFNREAAGKTAAKTQSPAYAAISRPQSRNRFTSFEQHDYSSDEMDIMEKAMLQNSEKKIRK